MKQPSMQAGQKGNDRKRNDAPEPSAHRRQGSGNPGGTDSRPKQASSPSRRRNPGRQPAESAARQTGAERSAGTNAGRRGAGSPAASGGSAESLQPGGAIVVTVKRLGINGEGVGYYKRKAVFIPGALPGEVVKAEVRDVSDKFLNASLVEIEKRSPDRTTPACPVYDECGGCQLQHMSYAGQLAAKEELVREAFARYTGMEQPPIRPIAGMKEPWAYRAKAQLQLGQADGRLAAGLYAAGSRKLVDITGCKVQHEAVNRVIAAVRDILAELGVRPYNPRTRQGDVRTLVARTGVASGKVQLTLITGQDRPLPRQVELLEAIRRRLPEVSAVARNANPRDTPLVFGDVTRMLWGEEQLEETLGPLSFSLSPRAFFQLNPEQTVTLYDYVKEAAGLTGRELVVDAYCGTGTIGLWLAPLAREVRGIEVIPEAVEDARRNARISGLSNARFFAGKSEELLPQWIAKGERPDVIVADPPRTGCDAKLLQAIIRARPRRFVYVSCNPSTLAKDCRVLLDGGFRLEWVQPVDMFPHTAHVECCSLLVRNE